MKQKMGQKDGNGENQGSENAGYGTGGKGGMNGRNGALIRGGVNVVNGGGLGNPGLIYLIGGESQR